MSMFSGDDFLDWDEAPLPSSDGLSSSSMDLKNQLSQLQQKLNSNDLKPVRPPPNQEPEIHLPPIPAFSSASTNSPMIASTRQNDKSVDFLGDLSDSLLMESRKLSYENKQMKKQLQSLTAENELAKKKLSNLDLLNKQLSNKETEQNDLIWNLESELETCKKSVEKSKSDFKKIESDNKNALLLIEQLKSSLESLSNEKDLLLESTDTTIARLNVQLSEFKESNGNLNDENDILHKNILNLKEEIENLKVENSNHNNNVKPGPEETSFSEFDDSILQEPTPALLDADISNLDTESLQQKLKSSYRQVFRLKSQNNKMKTDLLKMKHQMTLPNTSNVNKSKEDERENDNSWGDFENDSFLNTKPKDILVPSTEETDAEDDNEKSFLADISQLDGSSPVASRKPSISKFNQSFLMMVPKTTLSQVEGEINVNSLDFSKFKTVPVPINIVDELLTNSEVDEDDLYVNENHLQLLPSVIVDKLNEKLNSLQEKVDNPSIDYIKSKLESHSHIALPKDEHTQLTHNITDLNHQIADLEKTYQAQSDSLADLSKKLEASTDNLTKTTVELEQVKGKYENPSVDYLKSKAGSLDLIALDNTAYQTILTRVENLQNKIQESNSHLTTLSETIEKLKMEKTVLEEKIRQPDMTYMKEKSSLLQYSFIPESEHFELKSNLTMYEAQLREKNEEVASLTQVKEKLQTNVTGLEKQLVTSKSTVTELETKLSQLQKSYDSPDINYIASKSKSLNVVAIPLLDLTALKSEKSNIEREMTEIKYQVRDLESANSTLLNNLIEKQKEIDDLSSKITLLQSEKNKLELSIETPNVEYIKSKASLHNLTAIPMEEHDSLKHEINSKNIQLQNYMEIKEELNLKHGEISLLAKEKEELNSKIKDASDSLKTQEAQLMVMMGQIDSPTLEYIKKKSPIHNVTVVGDDEYKSLKQQLLDNSTALTEKERELNSVRMIKQDLEKQFEIQGLETVSLELHEVVQSELIQTKKDLDQQKTIAENLRNVEKTLEVKENELAELADKACALEKKAVELDETRLELESMKSVKDELNEKRKEIEAMKITEAKLQERINSLIIKESELEQTLQKLEEKDKELSSLRDLHDNPGMEYLKEKSISVGYIPITLDHHSESKSNLTQIEDLKQKINLSEDTIVNLSSKNNELSEVNSNLEQEIQNLLREKQILEKPNVDYIKEKSTNLGLVPIQITEYDNMTDKLNTLGSEIDSLQNKIAGIEAEKTSLNEKIGELENMQNSPSIEYIKSKSTSLGIIPIPIIEHTSLQSELQRKDILLKENKLQLKELENLQSDMTSKTAELEKISQLLNETRSLQQNPSIEYLKDKLTSLNYITVSDSEYKQLEESKKNLEASIQSLTDKLTSTQEAKDNLDKMVETLNENLATAKKELEEKSEELTTLHSTLSDSNALSKNEINSLNGKLLHIENALKDKDTQLSNANDKLLENNNEFESLVASLKNELEERNCELEELNNKLLEYHNERSLENSNLKQNNKQDELDLHQLASNKDFALVPYPEAQKGLNMQKSSSVATVTSENIHDLSNQPIDAIIPILSRNGYTVLSTEEYQSMKKLNDDGLDNLADITHEMEDIESDIMSKQHMLDELEKHSRTSNSSIAASSSASSISSSRVSINSSLISVENILTQKANNLKAKIDQITKGLDDLHTRKVRMEKQISRLSVASAEVMNESLNDRLSKKLKKINNEIEVKEIELKSQQSALTAVEAYIQKSKGMNLPPVSTPMTGTDDDAHVVDVDLDNEKIIKLESEISELQTKYQERKSLLDSLKKDINASDEPSMLAERLTLLGYEITSPSGDRFIRPSILRIEDIPVDDLKLRLKELGYVVMKQQAMNLLVAKSKEPKLPDSFTAEQLQPYVKQLNLRLLSENDIDKLKKRTINARELANKAADLNLVLLTQDEVKKLKENEPITKENITERGKDFGLLCIPSNQFVATTVSRTADIPNVTVLPNTYYTVLTKSHEWYKKNRKSINTNPPPPRTPTTIPENDTFEVQSFSPGNISQQQGPNMTHLPGTNIDNISLHTVDTVISNKREIVAAVTQTIIGEYLFKYYRKLGPFTSISDTRHERYFWIHPYSMTLYWSIANPVLCDPAKNQIKALSILDVQSVDDNNPLPAGIYHKSIVIKSYNKNIKITCPTRQIHNIWYNSLKYLLDRTSDGWINDDDLENQYEQDFTLDKKTTLERTASQNVKRVHTTRRPPSSMSFRSVTKSGSLRSMSGLR